MTENEIMKNEENARTEEEFRLNEEIVRSLRKLNAMSRRGPRPEAPDLPPPPDAGHGEPHGDPHREHGRGRIMGILHDRGSMSQCRLAELLDIRPQSLSELLVKMEGDGLVRRAQSEEDRRQIIVSLTEAGGERVAAFREAHRRHIAAFLSPLTREEKTVFAELLQKLTAAQPWTENGNRPAPVPEGNADEAHE